MARLADKVTQSYLYLRRLNRHLLAGLQPQSSSLIRLEGPSPTDPCDDPPLADPESDGAGDNDDDACLLMGLLTT